MQTLTPLRCDNLHQYTIVGHVPCGRAETTHTEHRHFFQVANFNPKTTYLFTIHGDSMVEADFHDGDIAFVDASREAVDGDIVLAEINGEQTIKRLRIKSRTWRTSIILVAENPRFQPIEIAECDTVRVLGVVVGKYQRMF